MGKFFILRDDFAFFHTFTDNDKISHPQYVGTTFSIKATPFNTREEAEAILAIERPKWPNMKFCIVEFT